MGASKGIWRVVSVRVGNKEPFNLRDLKQQKYILCSCCMDNIVLQKCSNSRNQTNRAATVLSIDSHCPIEKQHSGGLSVVWKWFITHSSLAELVSKPYQSQACRKCGPTVCGEGRELEMLDKCPWCLPQDSSCTACFHRGTRSLRSDASSAFRYHLRKQKTVTLGEEININREDSYLRAKFSILPSQCGILEASPSFSSFSFAFSKLL